MKRLTLLFLVTFIVQNVLFSQSFMTDADAQSCLPEGITFNSQEEIDDYQIDYPNCTEIEGNVHISGHSIKNLNGLSVLTSIGGDLIIFHSDSLTTLSGLENLTSIGGSLGIAFNWNLVSLSALESLISIGGDLSILSNHYLSNCDAEAICSYLTSSNGIVEIYDNAEGCSSIIQVAVTCGTTIPCLEEGEYRLYSQFDVDHFPVVFPDCNDIECNIEIRGNDIVNLDSLNMISSIKGDLSIQDNSLTTLNGLENLTSIDGNLVITGNLNLTTLSGLEKLYTIRGDLAIYSNDALTTTTGLEDLFSIGESFFIAFNENLTSISGLEDLSSIGGQLEIINNNKLTAITGLENISYIGEHLKISDNYYLTSLNGFDNLAYIGEYLSVINNDALTSLTGLENLSSIGGTLSVSRNADMISLEGLDSLDLIGGDLIITMNPSLSDCEIEAICSYLANPNGFIDINYNAEGCSSMIEVAVACGTAIPCLEEGTYNLYSQFDVDHFPVVFPVCSDLACDFFINGDDITSLDSLGGINSIDGNLSVGGNDILTSLAGLENLVSLSGDLTISSNGSLTSLTGLDGLESIGGFLTITLNPLLNYCEIEPICSYITNSNGFVDINENADGCSSMIEVAVACGTTIPCLDEDKYYFYSQYDVDHFPSVFPDCNDIACDVLISGYDITNLDSLSGITSILGDLSISENAKLTTLEGLENLTFIGEKLLIGKNTSLTNLSGIGNLTSIGENFLIETNTVLTSLTGPDNLTFIGGYLTILNNNALPNLKGLEGLETIGGRLEISNNYSLTSLTGLDNLKTIEGYLSIYFNVALTNLTGLQNLDTIGNYLILQENNALVDLTGLDNLYFVGGGAGIFSNAKLTSLSGLENLSIIGEGLYIGAEDYDLDGNPSLTSLTALSNLRTLWGEIQIYDNEELTSLTGLENIETGTITKITITDNPNLSFCAAQSICDYLAEPNASVDIEDNASGCDHQAEVDSACVYVYFEESFTDDYFVVYPNPFPSSTTIEYELNKPSTIQLTIYDHLGKQLEVSEKKQAQGKQQFIWNAEGLPNGVYFCLIKTNQGIFTTKLIKL